MKCSQIKCIVNRLVGHREVRPDSAFSRRPEGVVCEQVAQFSKLIPNAPGEAARLAFLYPRQVYGSRPGLAGQILSLLCMLRGRLFAATGVSTDGNGQQKCLTHP